MKHLAGLVWAGTWRALIVATILTVFPLDAICR